MVRKLVVTGTLTMLLLLGLSATASETTHSGVIFVGQGPCPGCTSLGSSASVKSYPIPDGATWKLSYEATSPTNRLGAYVRCGQYGTDYLSVYGEQATVAQPFDVVLGAQDGSLNTCN